MSRATSILGALLCSLLAAGALADPLPTIEQVNASVTDILAEAAIRQPGGPSYEFFLPALPPLRYVDAGFRVYPITLSAPGAKVKGRLIGDGSQINALARQPNWGGEVGTPVTIRVGHDREVFGRDPGRLTGPAYHNGYLPIVQTRYGHEGADYGEEVFAGTSPEMAESGVLFLRMFVAPAKRQGVRGKIELQIEGTPQIQNKVEGNTGVLRRDKRILACYDKTKWVFNVARSTLTAILEGGDAGTLAIFTLAAENARPVPADAGAYEAQREQCVQTWDRLLARGTHIETPEAIVNNAHRALVIGSFMLLSGDDIRYSAGNQYAKLYIGEGGDATRSMLLMGFKDDARRMIPPLFDYTRKNLEFHQAAFKLQMLAHYFRLTRDADFVQAIRPKWEKELNVILNGREKSTGMLPREKYCGDIDTMVYSLNSNSNCWRALRDVSVMLADLGEANQAAQLAQTAAQYRRVILDALNQNIQRSISPPFVPIALSGEEEVHDPIWSTKMGSYWNLMIEYVLGSGVFRYDSPIATDICRYLQRHGGLCMGMLRARAGEGEDKWWVPGGRINDLYGMRYAILLQQRDEPDRALVSFYGKLAQGMTRNTFIGAEGTSINPVDAFGRQMYLPPNSAANANFLWQLRYLLVQDWDLDDDGVPETLRLLFATPRAWLADGKQIMVERAPTSFGEVSVSVRSELKAGRVTADVSLPEPPPGHVLLRFRLPEGYKITSASAAGHALNVTDGETLDLSAQRGHVAVEAKVGE